MLKSNLKYLPHRIVGIVLGPDPLVLEYIQLFGTLSFSASCPPSENHGQNPCTLLFYEIKKVSRRKHADFKKTIRNNCEM